MLAVVKMVDHKNNQGDSNSGSQDCLGGDQMGYEMILK